MSQPTREQVFAALFALVQTGAGFVTTSRTLQSYEAVDGAAMPACFQWEGPQTALTTSRQPTRWVYKAELFVYVHQQNAGAGQTLSSVLNAQIEAALSAIGPSPASLTQTLGGLVTDVRVNGTIEVVDQVQGATKSVAIIPLEIHANV